MTCGGWELARRPAPSCRGSGCRASPQLGWTVALRRAPSDPGVQAQPDFCPRASPGSRELPLGRLQFAARLDGSALSFQGEFTRAEIARLASEAPISSLF